MGGAYPQHGCLRGPAVSTGDVLVYAASSSPAWCKNDSGMVLVQPEAACQLWQGGSHFGVVPGRLGGVSLWKNSGAGQVVLAQ